MKGLFLITLLVLSFSSCIKKKESLVISLNSISVEKVKSINYRYLVYNISIFNNSRDDLKLGNIFKSKNRIYGRLITADSDTVFLIAGFSKDDILKANDSVLIAFNDNKPILKGLDSSNSKTELSNLVYKVFKDSRVFFDSINPYLKIDYFSRKLIIK